ncbi:MAG TPA: peptide chain release factor N(5)-glutamine methyltransferase [Terracidiphilus sp.]|jgi:release factor glutamine methyltransferase|nr:peptide chain release factor N(5)-glutamine methyltransferase [Terracidiphilus sp.]
MTVDEWLRKGEALLGTGPHPERARPDAELLLRHLLKLEWASLLARRKERLDENEAAHYLALLERRLAGEPVQYILGAAEFYGIALRLTRDVLIPRPETEHVVEKVIELAASFHQPRILDVGTGSGAIAIAVAHDCPAAVITATDVSVAALETARENAARAGFADRILFLHGDLLAPVAGEQFDVVVSNPPYVAESERDTLAVEVREYEPAMALFAGDDGLAVYRRLIPATRSALVPGGFLVLEIGYGQAENVGVLLLAAGFDLIEFTPDLQGIPRVASARRVAIV